MEYEDFPQISPDLKISLDRRSRHFPGMSPGCSIGGDRGAALVDPGIWMPGTRGSGHRLLLGLYPHRVPVSGAIHEAVTWNNGHVVPTVPVSSSTIGKSTQ